MDDTQAGTSAEATSQTLVASDFFAAAESLAAQEILSGETLTLGALPVGARLVVRCRADWRAAVVSEKSLEKITLKVCSPFGSTYRLRRAPDLILILDGVIPVLLKDACETDDETRIAFWRAGFARYDMRW